MATDGSHPGWVGPTGHGEGLPAAVIEDLLACPRRRVLLTTLVEADEPVTVEDLAAELAAAESAPAASVSAADRRRARTEVFQEGLPKLTATDVVAFDSRLGTVEFTGPEALATRLDALAEE
ncbi:DUF7344 domain-containing protein [Halorientalis salina]|uniref:DUF7344 domain-containing protein n=1 Tax=Halorientalis salina TaxID=2932266 RepID=UPI0010AD19A2|nr:hypothetical protein [Halorientalis salina]